LLPDNMHPHAGLRPHNVNGLTPVKGSRFRTLPQLRALGDATRPAYKQHLSMEESVTPASVAPAKDLLRPFEDTSPRLFEGFRSRTMSTFMEFLRGASTRVADRYECFQSANSILA